MPRTSLGLLAAAAIFAASPARAGGVVAQVERQDGGVAVRARSPDGLPLAGATYVVRSPRGGEPFAEGRTDRHGWAAFAPDAPGRWTVRIADASGHGTTVEVAVTDVAAPAPARAPPPPSAGRGELQIEVQGGRTGETDAAGWWSSDAFRALAAVTALVLAFRILLAVQRARRAKGR